jgi:hypothetical protein
VTDVHLINWTIEEAKLLEAERLRPGHVNPIPSLDEILIWPESDPLGRSTGPIDSIAKSIPTHSSSEPVPIARPLNDTMAAHKPESAPYTPLAVSVSFSTSLDVRIKESESSLATEIPKPDVPVDPDRMIFLRWVLRDIRGKRLKWWPVNQHDLRTLMEMGLVEMSEGMPVLTAEGNRSID